MTTFKLSSKFKPRGDQPQAIREITKKIKSGTKHQTLLGVTGSGKTFTMANVIQNIQKPILVISHNKTLAAQLAEEFKEFFPENAVHYFVSYYDYYQPEAYMPSSDTYIEKETSINEEIDRLRHASTQSLLTRKDVIIVASVSCIYGLGSPDEYRSESVIFQKGDIISLTELSKKLTGIRYDRNDIDLNRGKFRIKGDTVDIFQPFALDELVRIEMWGDKIDRITTINQLTGKTISQFEEVTIFPATHYLAPEQNFAGAIKEIKKDMVARVKELQKKDRLIEAQRIEQRVLYDLEMIKNTGYCNGIENYSSYFDGRKSGQPPFTLMDFFPEDYQLFIDESHMTVPQVRGMFAGDQARKTTLIDFGFRLPSALDNRPLNFKEFLKKINKVVYTSATPAEFEIVESKENIVEQVIRPTGLLDPEVTIKPTKNQIDDLLEEIKKTTAKKQRVLITTLTKRMSEELTSYLQDLDIKACYLHSEIDTFERVEILQKLRQGTFDVLVGINLLREGLDLPEVSLVAILDADKEGFLRSESALMQTMGRAARHAEGRVIMYADKVTGSMERAIKETERRRKVQEKYNKKHNITPQTIIKEIKKLSFQKEEKKKKEMENIHSLSSFDIKKMSPSKKGKLIQELTTEMELAAENLEFEKAAALRDAIGKIKKAQ
jgi:excinuclease ABC subunit B